MFEDDLSQGSARPELLQIAESVARDKSIDQNIGYACGQTIYKYTDALSIGNEEKVYSILPDTPVINYPNPFNPSTTIVTYIPESGLLQVSVIDLLGRNIRMLYDDMIYEGESWKEIVWDGLDNNRRKVPG